jgi:hypothetical protein
LRGATSTAASLNSVCCHMPFPQCAYTFPNLNTQLPEPSPRKKVWPTKSVHLSVKHGTNPDHGPYPR